MIDQSTHIKTNITKDGWSANVIDKKDKIQIKIGE
jgi:uncharacterized protein YdeI (BOF family)